MLIDTWHALGPARTLTAHFETAHSSRSSSTANSLGQSVRLVLASPLTSLTVVGWRAAKVQRFTASPGVQDAARLKHVTAMISAARLRTAEASSSLLSCEAGKTSAAV